MRCVADENVDSRLIRALRSAGHEVISIAEQAPGIGDDEVLAIAHSESRLLLTCDKDFGELVYRQRRASAGVLLLRLAGVDSSSTNSLVCGVLAQHQAALVGAFSVLTVDALRIR